MKNLFKLLAAFLLIAVIFRATQLFHSTPTNISAAEIAEKTWAGFKYYFIEPDGRVNRPNDNNDTVSEGQAYAMLRAVWMNDRETFDKCYKWTENNLSRFETKGDNLLAWHWKDGQVIDWMPASDADIDYALALIFADARWKNHIPFKTMNYSLKAKQILSNILNLETYSTSSGRLYLAPWIITGAADANSFPVNPSYYSPAHFRIFYEYTKDTRWLKLADTTYYVLNCLTQEFVGHKGIGLVPDWCSVNSSDRFGLLNGKDNRFGYESIRVPFRIGLDFLWFKNEQAKTFLIRFSDFLDNQFSANGAVFCEYDYSGRALKKYEDPAFYSCYYYSLAATNSKYTKTALQKNLWRLKKNNDHWYYQNSQDYYSNCLAWYADGARAGVIKNLFKE